MSQPQAQYITGADGEDANVLRLTAQVFKIQTLVDGGVRVTLDLVSPVAPDALVALFDAKQPGVMLEIAALVVDQDKPYKRRKNENGK